VLKTNKLWWMDNDTVVQDRLFLLCNLSFAFGLVVCQDGAMEISFQSEIAVKYHNPCVFSAIKNKRFILGLIFMMCLWLLEKKTLTLCH
jgi:hypothetical protein